MTKHRASHSLLIFLFVIPALASCSRFGRPVAATPTPSMAEGQAPVADIAVTAITTASPPSLTTENTPVPAARATEAAPTASSSPTPASTSGAAMLTGDPFAQPVPVRDDVRLAVAFKGVEPLLGTPTSEPPIPQLGDQADFFIGNVDVNTVSTITAVLQGVGRHAYYWYDEGVGGTVPDASDLAATIAAFDSIYERVDGLFGDGTPEDDPPVNIVHVSPLSLCDVALNSVDQCGLAGYFSSRDELPRAVNASSNEREMFVMNSTQIGRDSYLDVLAHELRHLIEARFDSSEADWAVEGSAMLAAQLAGYDDSAQWRGNMFLSDPDLQLNTWSDSNTLPHYGQGYLLSRFLYDQLGEEAYRSLATSSLDGLDAVAGIEPQGPDGQTLWQNWLAAMALTADQTGVPPEFQWSGPALESATTTSLATLPARIDTTVSQYAADYYELTSSGSYDVTFEGAASTPLLPLTSPGGGNVWYALRSNYSNPRLTRTLDLRGLTSASLQYDSYVDIEEGYDFAYVSVSEDDGITWQPLAADGMQGRDGSDDPSQSAVADRFYTGRQERWISEEIDLSPYAGQVIDLRFEYVTDPILTYGGFAVDNIRVPELSFADDAESNVAGWTAEGFVRVPLSVAQSWHLWLITFHENGVQVEPLVPDENGRLDRSIEAIAGERAPILIVAAYAPQTLESAAYQLTVEN